MAPSASRYSRQTLGKRSATKSRDGRPNASILSFFQRVEVEESLFISSSEPAQLATPYIISDKETHSKDENLPELLYEVPVPSKRRRLSSGSDSPQTEQLHSNERSPQSKVSPKSKPKLIGGFILDSDSGGEEDVSEDESISGKEVDMGSGAIADSLPSDPPDLSEHCDVNPPTLDLENGPEEDEYLSFTDGDNGEEYREMIYMQEQARIEARESGICFADCEEPNLADDIITNCPVCQGSLAGITTDEATRHVNNCLDGNPTPLPVQQGPREAEPEATKASGNTGIFAKAAIPRPGQANPFDLESDNPTAKSAFSMLMSGHAEDSAWSVAAAAEVSSRGRHAYQRTCPFYKIMPGFFICVDAFRYGAVEGCKAYFLSHFHSDHYIGLTRSWSHGPIYCSRVTANLVKSQLRVAEKWVVALEFEEEFTIPDTNGVSVTMIPANHCPGSSLFLFEKSAGNDPIGRKKRLLHCGDFRACTAHVTHPLLQPQTVDSISGRLKQQRIDICYLDTTYLNPRYSFPPQDDVIKACAELCRSLSATPAECFDKALTSLTQASANPTVSQFFVSKNERGLGEGPVSPENPSQPRLLVVCGTYSIGKEKICVAIAQALNSKIYAPPGKKKILSMLEDPELAALLTSDPLEAQVHMQTLMEIRAETLQEYLNTYKPKFNRIIGFRPSGWTYRPKGASKLLSNNTNPTTVPTSQILHGSAWHSRFHVKDLEKQRGSTKEAMCFGVPYSEHSSFRELAMFVLSLHIEKIVPTVNVGNEVSRKRMKAWLDRWTAERRRGGVLKPLQGDESDNTLDVKLWDGKDGNGGGAWW